MGAHVPAVPFTLSPSLPSPSSPAARIFVNLEMAEKMYSKRGEHMCPLDGYVAFRNSELICGRLGKVRGRGGQGLKGGPQQ